MNKTFVKKIVVLVFLVVAAVVFSSFSQPRKVEASSEILFPEDYRSWTHIKTAVNNPSFATHSGFHHIYANKKAMKGYKTGKFPDGSIIVFDVLESVEQKNGDVIEGKRKLLDVMVKDRVKFRETGGWGYEEFIYGSNAEIKKLNPAKTQCFTCHTAQKDDDYIFSKYRN